MVKFINRLTGGEMYVSEDRVEEYKAAGHKLAADLSEQKKSMPVKKAVPAKTSKEAAKPAAKSVKKAAGKKK